MKQMTLDEVKSTQVEILKYIDEICERNNIKYSLAYGTLIGAVRHGGFIPWDDDIDIILMREEYEKLLNILYQEENELYQVLSPKDEGYWYSYAKVTDKRTLIVEKNWPTYEKLGVFVDIIPIDYLPEDDPKSLFDEAMIIDESLKYCLTDIAYSHDKSYMRLLKKLCRFRKVNTCRKFDEWYWKKEFEKVVAKSKPSKYIGCIAIGPYKLWNSEMMETFSKISFEGIEFQTVKEYDKMLKKTYGNYMKLPPEEQRVSNHDFTPYWR